MDSNSPFYYGLPSITSSSGGYPEKGFQDSITEIDDSFLDSNSILTIPEMTEQYNTFVHPSSVNGNFSSVRDEFSGNNANLGNSWGLDELPILQVDDSDFGYTSPTTSYLGHISGDSDNVPFCSRTRNVGNNSVSYSENHSIQRNIPGYTTKDSLYTGSSPGHCTEDPYAIINPSKWEVHLNGNFSTLDHTVPTSYRPENPVSVPGSYHPSTYSNMVAGETQLEPSYNPKNCVRSLPTGDSSVIVTPGHAKMTSLTQDKRRFRQHRSPRVRLPEGEKKIQHKRQLANTRAKDHYEKKKYEMQEWEVVEAEELVKNRMLRQKCHTLVAMKSACQKYHDLYIKQNSDDCTQP